MRVPSLYQFFRHQLQHGFQAHGLKSGPPTVDYVSEVLTRFADTRAAYSLHDDDGRPLEHIVDMLAVWAQTQEQGRARTHEGVIVRHIGEYTLFMSGLFRERVTARGELEYYVAQGRSAYWRSADYEINPARRQLFRRLYQDFAPISDILDYLRRVQFPLRATGTPHDPLAAYWRA